VAEEHFAHYPSWRVLLALQNIPSCFLINKAMALICGFTAWTPFAGQADWMMARLSYWLLIPLFSVLMFFLTWFFRKPGRSTWCNLRRMIVTWVWAVGNLVMH